MTHECSSSVSAPPPFLAACRSQVLALYPPLPGGRVRSWDMWPLQDVSAVPNDPDNASPKMVRREGFIKMVVCRSR